MQKVSDILFIVKFEDGKKEMKTAGQIAKLKDRRKYAVINPKTGKIIFSKSFRGL